MDQRREPRSLDQLKHPWQCILEEVNLKLRFGMWAYVRVPHLAHKKDAGEVTDALRARKLLMESFSSIAIAELVIDMGMIGRVLRNHSFLHRVPSMYGSSARHRMHEVSRWTRTPAPN